MKKLIIITFLLFNVSILFSQKDTIYRLISPEGKVLIEGKYIVNKDDSEMEIRIGEWKEWDTLGNIKVVWNYKNGRYCGPYTEYYPNGSIKIKGQYHYKHSYKVMKEKDGSLMINQVPYGLWKYYDKYGKLERSVKYDKKGNEAK